MSRPVLDLGRTPPNALLPVSRDEPYPGTLLLSVDATDLDRRIIRVHEEVPVSGGKELILVYPRWLPGTHAPEGTIDRLAGLVVTAGSAKLPWTRDTADVFAFHVSVPPGVSKVSVDFTYLSPVSHSVGRTEVSPLQLAVDWNSVVLYPAGYFTRQIPVEASIRVPNGWTVATALEVASRKKAEALASSRCPWTRWWTRRCALHATRTFIRWRPPTRCR